MTAVNSTCQSVVRHMRSACHFCVQWIRRLRRMADIRSVGEMLRSDSHDERSVGELKGGWHMIVEHHHCRRCKQVNKVEIPEDFEDKVKKFFQGIPLTTLKGLVSLGVGVFIAPPVGFAAATAM